MGWTKRIGILAQAAAAVLGSALALHAQIPATFTAGLSWRSLGPLAGPVAEVQGDAGQPGIYRIRTPSGETWQTTDGGESWRPGGGEVAASWQAGPAWNDPQNPARGIRVTANGNGVEITLDQGGHWLALHNLAIAQVAAVSADAGFPIMLHLTLSDGGRVALPLRDDIGASGAAPAPTPAVPARLKFRPAAAGVEASFDGGQHWQSLRLNLPAVAVKQVLVAGDSLVAATWGRSVWVLDNIEPLEQLAERAPAAAEPMLFRPPTVVRLREDAGSGGPSSWGAPPLPAPPLGAYFDFYLPQAAGKNVELDITDATGAVVHRDNGAPRPEADSWLPPPGAQPALAAHAGEIRVAWDGRADAPPSPANQYTRLAPALAGAAPQPAGPLLPAGTYELRLLVDGRVLTQPLRVVDDPRAAADATAERGRWSFERQIEAALEAGHTGYREVEALRAQLHPLLGSADEAIAQAALDLNTQLAAISGAGWNGLELPDEIETELEPIDDKDDLIDVATPVSQSLSQDYDDPTTILGRTYSNADTTPSFASAGAALAQTLTGAEGGDATPGGLESSAWQHACVALTQATQSWTAARADVTALNAELLARHAQPLALPLERLGGCAP